ncbi:hypothetical protein [Amnibacterium soli]|uniref:hypothetical protein n=1 Tax=Amnibacterium soli TaxID=1282736 RepID=UPI0031F0E46C
MEHCRTRGRRALRNGPEEDAAAATVEAEGLAAPIRATGRDEEQCVRTVPDDLAAAVVRRRVRRLAAADGVRVRIARPGDAAVVLRLDAAVWTRDAATVRRTLAPEALAR